jgi:hypothetical protein
LNLRGNEHRFNLKGFLKEQFLEAGAFGVIHLGLAARDQIGKEFQNRSVF